MKRRGRADLAILYTLVLFLSATSMGLCALICPKAPARIQVTSLCARCQSAGHSRPDKVSQSCCETQIRLLTQVWEKQKVSSLWIQAAPAIIQAFSFEAGVPTESEEPVQDPSVPRLYERDVGVHRARAPPVPCV